MKQLKFKITYKLDHAPNRRYTELVEAQHSSDARRLFEASHPGAHVIFTVPVGGNGWSAPA